MKLERWQKIEEIFNEALILPIDQRTSFITQKSAGDVELDNEINALILEAETESDFLIDSVFAMCNKLIKSELKICDLMFEKKADSL
jgi:hypothetical protein